MDSKAKNDPLKDISALNTTVDMLVKDAVRFTLCRLACNLSWIITEERIENFYRRWIETKLPPFDAAPYAQEVGVYYCRSGKRILYVVGERDGVEVGRVKNGEIILNTAQHEQVLLERANTLRMISDYKV